MESENKGETMTSKLHLGGSWALFGTVLGGSWAPLGPFWAPLGNFWASPGCFLADKNPAFCKHWSNMVVKRPLGTIWGRFGEDLGRIWGGLGRIWANLGVDFHNKWGRI